jgi:hypothetical protein
MRGGKGGREVWLARLFAVEDLRRQCGQLHHRRLTALQHRQRLLQRGSVPVLLLFKLQEFRGPFARLLCQCSRAGAQLVLRRRLPLRTVPHRRLRHGYLRLQHVHALLQCQCIAAVIELLRDSCLLARLPPGGRGRHRACRLQLRLRQPHFLQLAAQGTDQEVQRCGLCNKAREARAAQQRTRGVTVLTCMEGGGMQRLHHRLVPHLLPAASLHIVRDGARHVRAPPLQLRRRRLLFGGAAGGGGGRALLGQPGPQA